MSVAGQLSADFTIITIVHPVGAWVILYDEKSSLGYRFLFAKNRRDKKQKRPKSQFNKLNNLRYNLSLIHWCETKWVATN